MLYIYMTRPLSSGHQRIRAGELPLLLQAQILKSDIYCDIVNVLGKSIRAPNFQNSTPYSNILGH